MNRSIEFEGERAGFNLTKEDRDMATWLKEYVVIGCTGKDGRWRRLRRSSPVQFRPPSGIFPTDLRVLPDGSIWQAGIHWVLCAKLINIRHGETRSWQTRLCREDWPCRKQHGESGSGGTVP